MANEIETTHDVQMISPVVLELDHTKQMPVTTIKMRLTHRKKQPVPPVHTQEDSLVPDEHNEFSGSLDHYLFW